jgi:hypothetical protein
VSADPLPSDGWWSTWWSTWRSTWRVDVVTVANVLLLLLFLAVGVPGLILGPFASAPVKVPQTPVVSVWVSTPLSGMNVEADLNESSTKAAALGIQVYGRFVPSVGEAHWIVGFTGLTGRPCFLHGVAADRSLSSGSVGPDEYNVSGTSTDPQPFAPLLEVEVCWTASSPIALNGPYLSAAVPQVTAGQDAGSLTRTLDIPSVDLLDYSLQAGTSPSVTTAHSYVWTAPLSEDTGSLSSSELPVSAVSLAGLQAESARNFLAGILLGVSASAVVALFVNLAGSFDKARSSSTRSGPGVVGDATARSDHRQGKR